MKKIILAVITVPVLTVGALWFFGSSSLPTTEGEKRLAGLCFNSGHSREQCLCVFDGAREKLTEEEMGAAWEIRTGDRRYFGEKGEAWVHAEIDQRYAELVQTLKPNQTVSSRQRRELDADVRQEAREELERVKAILEGIVAGCGFR